MDASAIATGEAALFLDFDGTLVEIAPRPDAVEIPPGLPRLLMRLADRLGGALAVVSGRTIPELEAFLPIPLALAGEHGAAIRHIPGTVPERIALASPPPEWRERAQALALRFPGTLVEPKAHGFAVHYRLAPEAAAPIRALLETLIAGNARFELLPARMAWEVKPAAVSKGTAVATLLARAPFAGRRPVFVGDDVTDEAGMTAARAAGGLGLRLQDAFGTPAALRDWLARLAA
ncbi:trehalose-phosphatase [Falsiroseomonas oryziterrae]|uniref:trehalose-phosphatase n=1 Tax=Falsiroseomonas oryziterrae TaxID=2911368 RepID=UPI001EFFF764|nr:trehalose-phosphatase [Roseomonas sp. NPKOSM-4]